MKQKPSRKDIRDSVLNRRGLVDFKPAKEHSHKRFKPVPRSIIPDHLKTDKMRYFEVVKGRPIEEILMSGSLRYVCKVLDNQINPATVSKWIKRLKLRYDVDNLPNCDGCGRSGPACESGVCYILVEIGRYDLLIRKKEEMFDNG